jgi:hypothetical protein
MKLSLAIAAVLAFAVVLVVTLSLAHAGTQCRTTCMNIGNMQVCNTDCD